jgi:hypothetical protein
VSGESQGREIDLRAITQGAKDESCGVSHAAELTAFVEAALGDDAMALEAAREGVLRALGPEALVDAAAVIGNFERMTRIADGTGLSLDAPVRALGSDVRTELDLDRFASASRTPRSGAIERLLGRGVRVALRPLLRRLGRSGAAPGDPS